MAGITTCQKCCLLLWKNWLLQWNAKRETLFELILPVLYILMLIFMRLNLSAEFIAYTTYSPMNISNVDLIKAFQTNEIKYELYYSPENPFLEKIVKLAVEKLELTGSRNYSNAEALEKALIEANILAGIQFDDSWSTLSDYPKNFSFALRFPSELRGMSGKKATWSTNSLFLAIESAGPRNGEENDGGYPVGYLREGFLPVQNALAMSYIELVTDKNDLPNIDIQRYPYPNYVHDPLLKDINSVLALLLILSLMYSATTIVRYITTEKENQLKEVMKIMGLNNWVHWLAWFVKSIIMMGIPIILLVILLKVKLGKGEPILIMTNWSVFLFFMFVYLLASICFCFMLATFFSKANTASVISGLVWILAFLPYSIIAQNYNKFGVGIKLATCLLCNSAMAFGFHLILRYEGTGEGLSWGKLFTAVNVDDKLTMGAVICMMLASCFICMFICLYVEQINPGDFGVPHKWYYIFTGEFWCGNDDDEPGVNNYANEHIERQNSYGFELEPMGQRVGLQVKNLKKKFGKKIAVNGLSVNMYENEITVLLGHNGAGKTTTVFMLVGMITPTSGTAIVNGCDIRTNMSGARMSMGVCPQHNVLFDNLTVAQHLKFFSRLKGLKGRAMQKEVDKYIQLIELEDSTDVLAKNLSGGMKRKLSVCCALTGNAKIVLLDEPSSGLDPSARRQLWDLLQAEKTGRTILLTTHFMDEADVLGDRIAIMCDGELKCHGTSFFLKKKYGSGYRLICIKRRRCKSANVTTVLRRYIPDLRPESEIGSELTYLLPDSYSAQFEKMLSGLESQSDDLRISGYGISISSLEEVFMKVGAENANEETTPKPTRPTIKNDGPDDNEDAESTTSDRLFSENKRLLKGFKLYGSQWRAMLLKKFLNSYHNKMILLLQFLIPILDIICVIASNLASNLYGPLEPMTIDLTQYPAASIVLETTPDMEQGSLQHKISKKYKAIATSYGSNYKFLTTGDQNFTTFMLELGLTEQVRINDQYLASATITKENITAWLNNQPLHTAPLTVNLVHNAIIKALMDDSYAITVTNAPLPYNTNTKLDDLSEGSNFGSSLSEELCFSFCFVTACYIFFVIKERVTSYKLLQFVGGVKLGTFWLSQFLWDYFIFVIISFILFAIIACFQQDGFKTFAELARYFLILLIFGCSALSFTYLISSLFHDPASGFVRIFIINLFIGVILKLMIQSLTGKHKSIKKTLNYIFRIYPHFCLSTALENLYVNTINRKVCSADIVTKLPDEIRCEYIPLCCTTKPYFGWEEPGVLRDIVYLLATAVVYFLILLLLEYNICSKIKLLYYILKARSKKQSQSDDNLDEDVAKEQKTISNMSSSDLKATNLVLDRVTKYFGKFKAVNQLSLGVKPIECFGLLGVNGAGKTTTFRMMTGDEYITYGKAYVQGMDMAKNMNKIRKVIGYCPQFDAMMIDYTGRENLKIFCLIRGIRKDRIKPISEELATAFGFDKYLDEKTRKFSGGNKRKLSAAIALIGSPSVVYLDEPTTGMDPVARRQLWNMVNRIRDSGKSIVLTTHSMEECEALCTRLAIMVNGEFKCIGSTQHLKNKFSKGLVLKIKINRYAHVEPRTRSMFRPRARKKSQFKRDTELGKSDSESDSLPETEPAPSSSNQQNIDEDVDKVKNFVKREFPQAVLKEEYQGMLTYHIPLAIIKWSRMFGIMENNRESLNIEDYSISQTTLEEIFLEFAKHQHDDEREKRTNCCSVFN